MFSPVHEQNSIVELQLVGVSRQVIQAAKEYKKIIGLLEFMGRQLAVKLTVLLILYHRD